MTSVTSHKCFHCFPFGSPPMNSNLNPTTAWNSSRSKYHCFMSSFSVMARQTSFLSALKRRSTPRLFFSFLLGFDVILFVQYQQFLDGIGLLFPVIPLYRFALYRYPGMLNTVQQVRHWLHCQCIFGCRDK